MDKVFTYFIDFYFTENSKDNSTYPYYAYNCSTAKMYCNCLFDPLTKLSNTLRNVTSVSTYAKLIQISVSTM